MRPSLCTIAHYAIDGSRLAFDREGSFDAQERALRAQAQLHSLTGATIIAGHHWSQEGVPCPHMDSAALSLSPPS
jgi:hypothetical protein